MASTAMVVLVFEQFLTSMHKQKCRNVQVNELQVTKRWLYMCDSFRSP